MSTVETIYIKQYERPTVVNVQILTGSFFFRLVLARSTGNNNFGRGQYSFRYYGIRA